MAASAFAEAYTAALRDLSAPDLPKIKLLRDLARENVDKAPHIVAAVASHLFSCPPGQRLPALYLVDCLVKSVPAPYALLFSHDLGQLFGFVWRGAAQDQALQLSLVKLAGTWRGVLDDAVVSSIEAIIKPPQPPQPQPPQPQPQPQPVLLQPQWQPVSLPAPQLQQQPILLPPPPMLPTSAAPVYPAAVLPPHITSSSAWSMPLPVAPPSQLPANLAASLASLSKQFGVQLGGGTELQQPQQQEPIPLPPPPPLAGLEPRQRVAVSQSALKAYNQLAVDQLLAASSETRGRFLDLQFLRNRRRGAAGHRARPWFTTVEQWLEGTRAEQAASFNVFSEEEAQAAQPEAPAQHTVEEDPAQPTCAISGEAFERSYDPDTDKWYYEDAVVLAGEQAASFGVMEGSIVKVQCLAGAPAPLAASLGGPAAGQVEDVTPALMEAAAGAQAGANGDAQQPAVPADAPPRTAKRRHEEVEAAAAAAAAAGQASTGSGAGEPAAAAASGVELPAEKKTKV